MSLLLVTMISWMDFMSWKSSFSFMKICPFSSINFHSFIHWKLTNDITCMFIHDIWMTSAKGKIVNELHFMYESYSILRFHEISWRDSFIKIDTNKTWYLNSKPFNLLSVCGKKKKNI
jgi:hypothetical protein